MQYIISNGEKKEQSQKNMTLHENMHIDKMHVKLEYQLSSGMRGRL